jgi:hypothetical protein
VRLTNLLCLKVWIGVVVIRSLSMALFLSETQYQRPCNDISDRLIAIPHPSRIRRMGKEQYLRPIHRPSQDVPSQPGMYGDAKNSRLVRFEDRVHLARLGGDYLEGPVYGGYEDLLWVVRLIADCDCNRTKNEETEDGG